MLLIHILVATISVLYSAYTALTPTASKIRITLIMIALSLASGFVLVFTNHASISKVCISGLVYLIATISILRVAKLRLAARG